MQSFKVERGRVTDNRKHRRLIGDGLGDYGKKLVQQNFREYYKTKESLKNGKICKAF